MSNDPKRDSRTHTMTVADGSLDFETPGGTWMAYPEDGSWWANSYDPHENNNRLGPFATRDLAVQATLARY